MPGEGYGYEGRAFVSGVRMGGVKEGENKIIVTLQIDAEEGDPFATLGRFYRKSVQLGVDGLDGEQVRFGDTGGGLRLESEGALEGNLGDGGLGRTGTED